MRHFKRVILLALLFSVLLCGKQASAETVSGLWNILNGDMRENCTVELGVRFNMHMPFGEERCDMLNALLSHVKLRLAASGESRETEILIDGESAFSLRMSSSGAEQNAEYSFLPGTQIIGEGAGIDLAVSTGVDLAPEFELLQGSGAEILDDLYAWFLKLPELYSDNSKTGKDSQSFKNVGRTTEKTVVTVTKAAVEEGALKSWKEACPEGTLKIWLRDVNFTGRQQITLFRNSEGTVIRIAWSGQAAVEDGTPRKITLGWSRLRSPERDYDKLSLKSPATSGSDHDTVTLEYSESRQEDGSDLSLNLKAERVENRIKRNLGCSADLMMNGDILTGSVELSEKEGSGTQQSFTVVPELKFGPDGAADGTIFLNQKRGKDLIEDVELTVHTVREAALTEIGTATNLIREESLSSTEREALAAEILQGAAETLIRPLLSLPREDLDFLLYELDSHQIDQLYEMLNDESSERSAS